MSHRIPGLDLVSFSDDVGGWREAYCKEIIPGPELQYSRLGRDALQEQAKAVICANFARHAAQEGISEYRDLRFEVDWNHQSASLEVIGVCAMR